LWLPVVLFKSAVEPVAVLFTPVVLLKSAAVPTAVFCVPSPLALVSDVQNERPCPDSGVETAVGIAEKRTPDNCCVRYIGGEGREGILSFRCVEPGIASVRRGNDRFRYGQEPKVDKCECDEARN